MQNKEPSVCRQMCNYCYYTIRNGVCPIFGTYNTTFIQRIKLRVPRNIKQDIKFLKGGEES